MHMSAKFPSVHMRKKVPLQGYNEKTYHTGGEGAYREFKIKELKTQGV